MMPEQEATLSGYVTDTLMNPLNGALVRVYFHDTYEENYSNSMGYYHVTHIPLCYCLKNATCSKPGYQTQWVLLSISENTTYDFILTALNQTCYPVFNGTMGLNGWYISCVNISFVINGEIDALFYKVDGGLWTQYTDTFEFCQSGSHILYWYWTVQGEESETLCTMFSIDRTPPELHIYQERIGLATIKIIAVATDETTGINRVEFFVDGERSCIDYTDPYEGLINGIGIHHVNVIAFDNAGNTANYTLVTSFNNNSDAQFLHLFFSQKLLPIHSYNKYLSFIIVKMNFDCIRGEKV
jgi:hypothetical protein